MTGVTGALQYTRLVVEAGMPSTLLLVVKVLASHGSTTSTGTSDTEYEPI